MLSQSSEDDDDNVEIDFKSLVSIFQQGLKGLHVPPYKLWTFVHDFHWQRQTLKVIVKTPAKTGYIASFVL